MKIRNQLIIAAMTLLAMGCSAKPASYRLRVLAEYPHDPTSYTQGLFIKDGVMYESTGQYGLSTFRVVDMESGEALRRWDFDENYFVEGSVIFDGKLYILTWTSKVVFVYDAETFEYLATYSYPREGWGLTTDGKHMIASDGSSRLYFMDSDFSVKKTVTVKLNGRPVRMLNELEYINGKIWANVYTSDIILIINPSSGEVEGTVDCSGLLPRSLYDRDTDVLNGIAYDKDADKVYLTGKNWKRLYEVELVKKK